ncbi:Dachshund like protein 1 [Lucilia cuprina]|nr:Dachshund like protein 1 [Lucilia cuprina]
MFFISVLSQQQQFLQTKLNNIINNNNNNNNNNNLIMNSATMLMHHQQQQQQQQQQQNGGRDNSSSRGTDRGDERPNGRSSHTGRGSSCSPASSPTRHPNAVSPVTSLNHSMMQQMQQQHHQLSPPPHVGGVPTPNGLPAGLPPRMPHGLPPHSLGLLNSLQMMHHASPLELMAAAHHHVPPRTYNSPPPISTSDPSANECKLVEYRGQKVAAFIISGETMLCLPQAFELFLKHLVGGLHTVYTKLKRLDIVPLVCNVEQVRILRGLGAIQPGVNRCKLLSCKDFDILYRDCTTARCLSIKPPESNSLQFRSSRPGRPPKRGPVGLSLPPTHLSQHPQLKKHRLDNGDYPYENGHITDMNRLEKSPLLANGYNPPPINHMAFMQMNHHPGSALMSPGMPPHGLHARPDSQMLKAAAQSGMSAANMDALARSGIWENCRAAYEDIVKHLERLREERTDERQQMSGVGGGVIGGEQKPRDLSSRSPNRQSPVLNLSKSGGNTDQGSNCDERSERSDMHSPAHSVRDDSIERNSGRSVGDIGGGNGTHMDEDEDIENLSDDNVSEVDERMGKDDEDLSDVERDNHSPASQRHQRAHNMPHHNASLVGSVDRVSVNVLSDHDPTHPALQHGSPSHSAAVAALQHQRALNYSTLAAAAAAANGGANGPSLPVSGSGGALTPNEALLAASDASTAAAALAAGGLTLGPLAMDPGVPSSTETLLRNIQSLLKVAADNARQQERAISYEKAELKMDVLREREVKDSLERQLVDERKLRVLYQKRYRRERKMRIRYQTQIEGGKRKSPNAGGVNTSNTASNLSGNNNNNNNNSSNNNNNNNNSSSNNNNNNNNNNHNTSSSTNSNNSVNDDVRSIDSTSLHSKHSGSISDLTRKSEQDNDGKQSEKSDKSSMSSINSHHSQAPQQQQQQQHSLLPPQQQSDDHHHQQSQRHLRHHSESPSFKREPQSDHEGDNHSSIPHHAHHNRALSDSGRHSSSDRLNDRDHDDERRSSDRESNRPPSSQAENSLAVAAAAAAAAAANGKGQWQYPGIDLMATGAFWQNYSESLAQEIELERKTRSANAERDVKSPLAERQAAAYYKNSVLFGSAN